MVDKVPCVEAGIATKLGQYCTTTTTTTTTSGSPVVELFMNMPDMVSLVLSWVPIFGLARLCVSVRNGYRIFGARARTVLIDGAGESFALPPLFDTMRFYEKKKISVEVSRRLFRDQVAFVLRYLPARLSAPLWPSAVVAQWSAVFVTSRQALDGDLLEKLVLSIPANQLTHVVVPSVHPVAILRHLRNASRALRALCFSPGMLECFCGTERDNFESIWDCRYVHAALKAEGVSLLDITMTRERMALAAAQRKMATVFSARLERAVLEIQGQFHPAPRPHNLATEERGEQEILHRSHEKGIEDDHDDTDEDQPCWPVSERIAQHVCRLLDSWRSLNEPRTAPWPDVLSFASDHLFCDDYSAFACAVLGYQQQCVDFSAQGNGNAVLHTHPVFVHLFQNFPWCTQFDRDCIAMLEAANKLIISSSTRGVFFGGHFMDALSISATEFALQFPNEALEFLASHPFICVVMLASPSAPKDDLQDVVDTVTHNAIRFFCNPTVPLSTRWYYFSKFGFFDNMDVLGALADSELVALYDQQWSACVSAQIAVLDDSAGATSAQPDELFVTPPASPRQNLASEESAGRKRQASSLRLPDSKRRKFVQ